ncbi:MAG: N-methyl-D-aspartate receptor NMDAR2C subunit [Spirulina sp. SIO3F2]|nr:N-methyl-D-aspartate receptor NMDAR2C subunit [Spirulina sp. SIO3F2]
MFTPTTWHSHHQALNLHSPTDLFPILHRTYRSPQRHYHTTTHIADCLTLLAQHQHLAQHPAEIAIALWFHDAVYHPQRTDNEERSAAWAKRYVQQAGLANDGCNRIAQLILATRHPAQPQTSDEQLIIDIDLSILGQSPERFAKYAIAIRQEYAWVPETVYRSKRRSLLQTFLNQASIYHTPTFQEQYELQARSNLQQAIKFL